MPLSVPTREELDEVRRASREVNAPAFAYLEELVGFVVQALSMWTPNRKLSKYEWALLVHLARANYLVVYGIVQLCECIAGDLAMMQVRALYETMISAYWMSIRRNERAEKFDRFTRLENLIFNCDLVQLGVVRNDELPEHQRDPRYEAALRADFPKPFRGWSQVRTLEELEADVAAVWPPAGLEDYERYSQAARKLGNRHTHLSAGDAIARIAVEQDISSITLGPTQRSELWVSPALDTAAWCYGQLADLVVEHVGVTDLDRWREHLSQLANRAIRARAATSNSL